MAMDIVITIAEKIGDHLWVPIERQFGYLLQYNGNLETLRQELDKLEVLKNGLQDAVDAATRNGELIRPDVTHWITKVHGFKNEAMKFLEDNLNLDKRCFNGWFPNLVTRYHIGKEAKKKTLAAAKLQEDGRFDCISSAPPPLGIDSMSSANVVVYETTKVAISEVMEALENDNINFIGIHGMGGVGKTTLVKEVGKQAKGKKLFDEVVMAVVSQNIEIRKIQGQLADMLGLKFGEESEIGRAGRLVDRIKGVKKILIILDDVWARFDVADVGIPFGDDHKGCKIVITTRRLEVCTTMSVAGLSKKIVSLDVLTEAESWDLFGKNAGDVVDNPTFNDVAREIAKKCRGLPVAIVTVGRAMRGKEDPEEWKEAVVELRRSVPRNIEGVEENVVKCIKLSYDYVKDEEAKRCFLLCSLFPEDYDIEIETLVRYAVGLEIIEKVDTVQDVRRRVKLLIKKLKDSCLLIASMREGRIKMHDIVRDVALSIGSEEYFVSAGVGLKEWPTKGMLDRHTGASLMVNKIQEIPSNFSGKTNLRILLLQKNRGVLWKNSFFEGMKALRVLDVSQSYYTHHYKKSFLEIPPKLGCDYLTCLQTLVLNGNKFLSTSALGQIQTLVVLSLRDCSFEEAPTFIRNLTNLKLLDMSFCHSEIVFQPNSIACLSRLEELYLEETITIWEFGNELNSLCRLKVLTIYVPKDVKYIPEDFVFPSNLESFIIHTAFDYLIIHPAFEYIRQYPSYLALTNSSRGTIRCLNSVKALLKRSHTLCVESIVGARNIIPYLLLQISNDQTDLDVLKSLVVFGCPELEYLINEHKEESMVGHPHPHPHPHPKALSSLQRLTLLNLSSLRGLCNGTLPPSVMSLSKLRNLWICHCDNLSVAISPYSLLQRLKELEFLWIGSCGALEQLFDFTELGYKSSHGDLNLPLCNLKRVEVGDCRRLKQLFHPCMAQSLQKLEFLAIGDCNEIREIVTNENGHALDDKIVLKSLKEIYLMLLPNLDGFCMGSFPFEFPSLEQVYVKRCPKMKTFTAAVDTDTCPAINHTPKLKAIQLDDEEIMLQGVEDLNTVLQNSFKAKEMESASQGSN